ncbi:hypothetical protein L7F22_044003 [Adiantum nelumboides]|nr:hypothetical protein [Adiantum nelumboides]
MNDDEPSTSRSATESTDTDLSWLAPPPRLLNGITDHEWGLGIESSISDTGEGPNATLTEKLTNFHQLKQKGTHFNQSLNNNRSFRNPHIYAKLVDWIDVDENTSGYKQLLRKNGKQVNNEEAEKIWSSTSTARKIVKRNAGAERIAEMQKRQQEEFEKVKLHGKRERIDFAPASSSSFRERINKTQKIHNESERRDSGSRHHSKDSERYRDSRRHRDRHDKSRDHRKG